MSEIRVDTISEKTSGSGTTVSNLKNPNQPFRNVIINGDMHIWQRTTAATAMGNGAYSTVDRWVMYEGTDGAVTTEQSALSVADKGTTGCANALLAKCTTADTSIAADQYVIIEQRIEAQYLQHLGYGTSSAKSLTVSFWVKAYVAGTYNVALRKQDSTAYYISQEYTVDSSNTWEYKTLTFSPTAGSTSLITSANGVINNDSGEGIRLDFQLTLGSNFHATTNTWNSSIAGIGSSNQTNFVSSTDNTFYLTGVQLEVGSIATDFEHLPFDVNLQRCQRYCQKWDFTDSAGMASIGRTLSSNRVDVWFTPKLEMRAAVDAISDSLTTATIYRGDGTRHDSTTQTATALTNASKAAFAVRKTYSDTIEGDNLVNTQFGGTLIATCEL